MPEPEPKPGESDQAFLDRCMDDDVMVAEYPDSDQRYAVCNTLLEKAFPETAYDILARKEWHRLQERIGLRKADRKAEIVRDLQDALLTTWESEYKEALADAIRELQAGVGPLSDTEIEKTLSALRDRLGPGILPTLQEPLHVAHLRSYEFAQEQIVGVDFSFNLVDEQAIDALHDHNLYWVRNHYDNNLFADVEEIGEDILRQGLSRKEGGNLFFEKLGERYQQHSIRYWEGYSNHLTTRSREIGKVSAYEKAGTLTIEIRAVRDHRTSEICRGLHGKTYTVDRAITQRDRLINAQHPEDVKQIAPWYRAREVESDIFEIRIDGEWRNLTAMDGNDLPAGIALPPFHFDCRTDTVQYE